MARGAVHIDTGRWTIGKHLALSLYWFSQNFHWGALLTVAIPADVLRFVPEAEKERALGLVLGYGALLAMVVQPLAGAVSDRSLSRWGRRRPFVAVGTLLACAALLGMAYAPQLGFYAVAFLAVQLTLNVSSAAYQGLIPDLVPADQRGTASGFMGLMTMLGNVGGLGLAGIVLSRSGPAPLFLTIAGVLLAGMLVTLLFVREQPLREAPPFSWPRFLAGFWVSPRRFPDFAWLFLTRAVAMLGFYTLLTFLEYYLRDVLRLADFIGATTLVGLMVMAGATASTLVSGWLSDRVDRRLLVCLAAVLMGVTALVFVLTHSYVIVLVFSVLFGIGYGAFTSVDWALAVDVLPSAAAAGKDLGVWSISTTLPQVIAPLVGGQILFRLAGASAANGYVVLYGLAGVCFLLAALGVWRIRRSGANAAAAGQAV